MKFWLNVMLLLPAVWAQGQALELQSRRELFVDHYLLDTLAGAELRLQQPVERETVIRFDAPWEGRYVGYVTVFQDGERVRMYYRGLPTAGADGSDAEVTCYAESKDGLNFEKPHLGLFETHGTRENNVVLANLAPFSHNFAPFLDSREGVPADERYKAVAGTSETGLLPFASADGLNWRKLKEEAIITEGAFDSQNVAFWSEAEQQYLCYFRTWSGGGYEGIRSVSRCTSTDFRTWSAPQPMTFGDRPLEHLYTNETLPYFRAPQLYVAIAARFMPGRAVVTEEEAKTLGIESNYWKDISDNVFMSSRGGTQYDRTFMEGFIRPGIGLENWTSRTNYPAYGILQTSEKEMSLYVQHNYGQPTAHLVRYSLRPDGFISLHGPYAGGEATTKPFSFTGNDLYLNYSTSAAGFVKVEVQDETGKALEGYSEADAPEIIGNALDRPVRWNSGKSVAELAGKAVRLRFILKDADVFSLQFR